jgi:phenylalanyl-tRNA synthetase beta subunit
MAVQYLLRITEFHLRYLGGMDDPGLTPMLLNIYLEINIFLTIQNQLSTTSLGLHTLDPTVAPTEAVSTSA